MASKYSYLRLDGLLHLLGFVRRISSTDKPIFFKLQDQEELNGIPSHSSICYHSISEASQHLLVTWHVFHCVIAPKPEPTNSPISAKEKRVSLDLLQTTLQIHHPSKDIFQALDGIRVRLGLL